MHPSSTTATEAPGTLVLAAVPPEAWPALGAFIFRCNRSAEGRVRCLHGDQGEDENRYVAELAELPAGEAAFWHATGPRGETLGVIGCTFDPSLRRAWLRGPWAVPGPSSTSIESALLDALERGLPEIHRLDAFPNEDDAPLATLYGGAGYRRMDVHRVMQAVLGDGAAAATDDLRVRPAQPDDLRRWLPLHHALFPGSYLSDDEIAAAVAGGKNLVLTAWQDAGPAGYLFATDDATADELYVDYLGVDPASRGCGLGRALLLHALRWARDRGRGRAALTVRQDRAEALSLYLQCGFRQTHAGVHWRKDRAEDVTTSPPFASG